MVKLPWIPAESEWARLLELFGREPIRNRLMLALAYDSALRREELCSLRTDDVDPAHRTLRVRAETTKTRRERIVPYSASTGVLLGELPAPPRHAQPGQGPVVPVGIAAQPRRAADLVDLVEGGAPGRAGRGRAAVLHSHHPASVSDRSGPDGLGTARDRDLRRTPVHRVDTALHPPVRTGSGRPAEPLDEPVARATRRHAHREPRDHSVTRPLTTPAVRRRRRSRRCRARGPVARRSTAASSTDTLRCARRRPPRSQALSPTAVAPQPLPGHPAPDCRALAGIGASGRAAGRGPSRAPSRRGRALPARRRTRGRRHPAALRGLGPRLVGVDGLGLGGGLRPVQPGVPRGPAAADRHHGAPVHDRAGLSARRVQRLPAPGQLQPFAAGPDGLRRPSRSRRR